MQMMTGAVPANLVRLAHRMPLARCAVFAGLFLLSFLNSVAGQGIRTTYEDGWVAAAAALFGISAVLWAALVAGLAILHDHNRHESFAGGDTWVAAMVVAMALLPFSTASMAALTLLSLWAIFSSAPGSPLRRAGIIFSAISAALLWGRIVLALFSRPLLDLDAMFVAGLIGSQLQGNMLWYSGEPTRLIVAPGCSSMQGLSLALVVWVTINQFFEVRFGWRPALWCLAALAATVAINVLRMASMLRFPQHFDGIHTGWGYHLSAWLTLAVVAAICVWGARREIFRSA